MQFLSAVCGAVCVYIAVSVYVSVVYCLSEAAHERRNLSAFLSRLDGNFQRQLKEICC